VLRTLKVINHNRQNHQAQLQSAKVLREWQVFDIRYLAPRRDSSGEITREGSITAWLNGEQVQNDARFAEPRSPWHPFRYGVTPYLKQIAAGQQKTSVGPLFLQDHDAPVRFRNLWLKPLDDQAHRYTAQPANDDRP